VADRTQSAGFRLWPVVSTRAKRRERAQGYFFRHSSPLAFYVPVSAQGPNCRACLLRLRTWRKPAPGAIQQQKAKGTQIHGDALRARAGARGIHRHRWRPRPSWFKGIRAEISGALLSPHSFRKHGETRALPPECSSLGNCFCDSQPGTGPGRVMWFGVARRWPAGAEFRPRLNLEPGRTWPSHRCR